MSQLSRRTFSAAKRYQTVVFQEGTHPADFEMVEAQDTQRSEREALMQLLITDGAVGTGFLVVASGLSNAVNITPGVALSGGERMLLPDVLHNTIGNQYVYNMPVAVPTADRTDLIYLSIGVTNITGVQDPTIVDPTLGPGAYREQIGYSINTAQGSTTAPVPPQGFRNFPLATVARHAGIAAVAAVDVTDVRPIASLSNQFSTKNLITVSSTGAQFSNVQAALDSITGSSQTNQFIVLVGPGTYVSSTPITLSKPFVTLMGYDPTTTIIRVIATGGNAFTVSASDVTINNLGLDIAALSSGNNTIVSVSSGVDASIVSCLIGRQSYNESLAVAPLSALGIVGVSSPAANVYMLYCRVFGGNFTGATSGAGIVNGGGIVMSGTEVTAFSTGATSGTGAVVNNGNARLDDCSLIANDRCLYSSGPLTIKSSTLSTAPINAVSGTSANCMAFSGSTAQMEGCILTSTINRIDVAGTDVGIEDTSLGACVFMSGSTSSAFQNCALTAVEMSGASVDVEFYSCSILGGSNGTSVAIGNNTSDTIGLAVRAGATCQIVGCTTVNGLNAVIADGANPVISGCSFTSSATADVIDVTNSANPVIVNTTFVMLPGSTVSTRMINILDTTSNPSISGCFFQAPASSPPPVFIDGIVGSKLKYGINTPSLGMTLYSTNITLTTLESGFVSFTTLTSDGPLGGASLVGMQPISGSIPTNFQITATTAQDAFQQIEDGMNSSMNLLGFVIQTGLDSLRPYADSSPAANGHVNISTGTYAKSDGSGSVSPSTLGTSFTAVSGPATNYRIDLLCIDDSGTLSARINPSINVPAQSYPSNVLVIAEVTCNSNGSGGSPTITQANIKDVRGFLRSNAIVPARASTADALSTTTAPVVVSGAVAPTAGQVLTATSPTAAAWIPAPTFPKRYYASVTLDNASTNLVVSTATFYPALPGGTIPVVEVYPMLASISVPSGNTTVGVCAAVPGTPFSGSNPIPNIFFNVAPGDAISMSASAGSGETFSVNFTIVAIV